jgi:hypothetical protein
LFSNEKLWGGNMNIVSTKEEFKTQNLKLKKTYLFTKILFINFFTQKESKSKEN